jgi:ubiquitin-protein ligase
LSDEVFQDPAETPLCPLKQCLVALLPLLRTDECLSPSEPEANSIRLSHDNNSFVSIARLVGKYPMMTVFYGAVFHF